ncbi:MAG TPA: helix-hairpin-helix domain-containing protein [Myxococcota bacterium]|nr:helix-hairpin-helix domain-containing protein [Myxococcota bacterium]
MQTWLTRSSVGDLLEAQDADSFRVRAWRGAAATVRWTPRPLNQIFATDGRAALLELPGIGKSIASAIEELLHTGRLAMLDRLEGQISPEDLFTTVPGIGETLARRIHAELGIDTLEELELAAHDGRLGAMPGFGARRTLLGVLRATHLGDGDAVVTDEVSFPLPLDEHKRAFGPSVTRTASAIAVAPANIFALA